MDLYCRLPPTAVASKATWLSAVCFFLGTVCFLSTSTCHAESELIFMTGERSPYIGANLPQGGYVAELVSEAFRRSGYRVKFQYSTWARARLQAAQGDATGMIYSDAESNKLSSSDFAFSEHFFGGTTGLLKNRSLTLSYQADQINHPSTLFKTLKPYRFGAVRDGVTLPAFEQAQDINKELFASDLQNLDMLEQGRKFPHDPMRDAV